MLSKEILDQAGIVAYVDRDGVYRYVNRLWQEKTGLPQPEVIGKKINELIRGSSAMTVMKTGRKAAGLRYYTILSTGRTFSSLVKYVPVFDGERRVCGCTAELLFEDPGEAVTLVNELKLHAGRERKLKSTYISGSAKYTVDDIIGISEATERLKEQIYIAAESSATVLIEGETGTGKELVAHAIHKLSSRSSFPFVKVNCSAIPETLMESEFFGYEEGSFTGGVKGGRTGKFEAADHGSLFLDEINAMQLTMQPKLLRALQEKEIEKIGGTVSIPVDDRIIAAANIPLQKLVDKGEFRQDLYYRLNIIHIIVPPLRERTEDIRVLAEFFLQRYNQELNRKITGISEEASDYLMKRIWPGNIRELQNNIERAVIACRGEQLELSDFTAFGSHNHPERHNEDDEAQMIFKGIKRVEGNGNTTASEVDHYISDTRLLRRMKEEAEKETIVNALEKCRGNKSRTAELLGISRTLLYRKLKKYDIL